ncbi:hypothetical protein [Sedimentitalea sp.]|uniref:hypothetical protein n=1 Tax=Sedimentitalea sp. TaxID=2048915 RepID=UPI003296EDEF
MPLDTVQTVNRYDIIASTQPAESYLAASPVSAVADIVALRNAEGTLDLVSIGTTGELHYLTHTPDSDTGWKADVIDGDGLKIKKYISLAVARTADTGAAADRVFALVNASSCSLVEIIVNADETVTIEPRSEPFAKDYGGTHKITFGALHAGVTVGGIMLCTAVRSGDKAQQRTFLASWLQRGANTAKTYIAQGEADYFFENMPVPISQDEGPEVAVFSYENPLKQKTVPHIGLSYLENFQPPSSSRDAGHCTAAQQDSFPLVDSEQLGVLDGPDGRTLLLKVDHGLSTLLSDMPVSVESRSSWPKAWTTLDTKIPATEGDSGNVMFGLISGARDGAGRTVIAGQGQVIGDDRVASKPALWAISVNLDGSTSEVVGLATLGAQVKTSPAMRRDGKGEVHVFQPTPLNQLLHFWMDSDGNWQSDGVSITTESKAIKTGTYRTSLTVLDRDSNGPAAFVDVTVDADEEVLVEVNGKTFMLGGGAKPETFQTSAFGQLNVSRIITQLGKVPASPETDGTLASPVLTFALPDDPGSGVVQIRSEKNVHAALSDVTTKQLKKAKRTNGKKVFKNQDNLQNLQEGLARGLDLMRDVYVQPAEVPHAYRRTKDVTGMRFVTPDENGFVPPVVDSISASRPWKMEMKSGIPEFSDMDEAEADAEMAEGRRKTDASLARLRDQGFLGVDWDGIWSDIRAGVAEIKKLAVSGSEATVHFLVDGIEQVISFMLTSVKEVWSFVTTILDHFGKFWGSVVGWILKLVGGLFGWDDIIKNKDKFKDRTKTYAKDVPNKLPKVQQTYGTPFTEWLEGVKSDALSWAGAVNDKYGGDEIKQSNESRSDDGPKSPADDLVGGDDGVWSKVTWLFDKVMALIDELFGVSAPLSSHQSDTLTTKVSALMGTVGSGISSVVSTLFAVLETVVASTSKLGDETVSALLKLFTDTVGSGIGALKDTVDAALVVVQFLIDNVSTIVSWLDKKVSIPFFSSFYKAAIGSTCTLLDMSCLLLAIPATLASKLSSSTALQAEGASKDDNKTMEAVAAGVTIFILGTLTVLGDVLGAYDKSGLGLLCAGLALCNVLFSLATVSIGDSPLSVEFLFFLIQAVPPIFELVIAETVWEGVVHDSTDAMLYMVIGTGLMSGLMGLMAFDRSKGAKDVFAGCMLCSGALSAGLRTMILANEKSKSLVPQYTAAQAVATAATLGFHVGVSVSSNKAVGQV